jgi:hypothetical protein
MSGAGSKITFTLRAMLGPELPRSSTRAGPALITRVSAHSIRSAAAQATSCCNKSARACSFAAVAESLAAWAD